VQVGDEVVASAAEVSRSRRFASYQIDLHVGDELVASATGLAFRTEDWHLGEEVWPEDWKRKY
jgi:acyl-coenzyme A thioesterase PaaI-like protein